VLQRLARGQKAAAIAQDNGVSLETVRSQIRSIRVKLGVSSQLEAVALLRAVGG
jgi:DNA-binding CsgD family transcriptional regulator